MLTEQAIQQGFKELKQLFTQTNLSHKKALTLREAAVYTGRSLSNLYKLTSTGILPHSKPEGKMVYIDREELERWMLRNPVKTVEQIEQTAATLVTLGGKGARK